MKLSEFEYNCSDDNFALEPLEDRDEDKLLVLHKKTGMMEHKLFKNLVDYFDEGDLMVVNNTKVFPAVLKGSKEKTNAEITVTLLRELNEEQHLWDVLVEPARKIRIGNKLYFGEDESMVAEVIDNTTSRGRTLRFLCDEDEQSFRDALYSLGKTPLPDDLIALREARNQVGVRKEDSTDYQSIFAKVDGAVRSPTASLHFNKQLCKRCELKGIDFAEVTLHVGLGGFHDIEVEDLTKHKMESEQIMVLEDAVARINSAKDEQRRVCAVGTTVVRALESAVSTMGHVTPIEGWTNKFFFPPYEFQVANCLISNFHPSKSSMLMLECAFGGYQKVMDAYHEAIECGYRFGPYGDAMLIID